MEEKKEQLNNEIISQIKEGKVEMRPRWFFVLKTILGVLGAFILSLCLIFVVSFIVFGLKKSGIILAPGFGPKGFFLFVFSLPWVLIMASLAFLLVLQVLIRKYSFVYKKPVLYTALGIIGFTTLVSLLIPSFALHNSIFKSYRAEKGTEMPPVGKFYRGFVIPRPPDLSRGIIINFSTGTIIIANEDGATSSAIISELTKVFPGTEMSVGEEILIFGPRSSEGIIKAFGVREIGN